MKSVSLKEFTVDLKTIDFESVIKECCELVKNDAKMNCPVRTGALQSSIDYEVDMENLEGTIYAESPYALWVHQGTGAYAMNGDGRQGWWVYIKDPAAQVYHSQNIEPIMTKQEAIVYCKLLNKQLQGTGKYAVYTDGQKPQPFLSNALVDNIDKIREIASNGIKKLL